MNAVELKKASKVYDLGRTKVHALNSIDLSIPSGEFVTIAGPSGSGKSTLLNLIGCLDTPTQGEVWVAGRIVSGMSPRELNLVRRTVIGFVFQSFNLIPVLDTEENIELPMLGLRGIDRGERKRRVRHFADIVGLSGHLKHKPHELSGGQQQRVAIARALAGDPSIVLADEPTANLDSATGMEIVDLMAKINGDSGTTFIFSSHDPRIVDRAHRVFRLRDGSLEGEDVR